MLTNTNQPTTNNQNQAITLGEQWKQELEEIRESQFNKTFENNQAKQMRLLRNQEKIEQEIRELRQAKIDDFKIKEQNQRERRQLNQVITSLSNIQLILMKVEAFNNPVNDSDYVEECLKAIEKASIKPFITFFKWFNNLKLDKINEIDTPTYQFDLISEICYNDSNLIKLMFQFIDLIEDSEELSEALYDEYNVFEAIKDRFEEVNQRDLTLMFNDLIEILNNIQLKYKSIYSPIKYEFYQTLIEFCNKWKQYMKEELENNYL